MSGNADVNLEGRLGVREQNDPVHSTLDSHRPEEARSPSVQSTWSKPQSRNSGTRPVVSAETRARWELLRSLAGVSRVDDGKENHDFISPKDQNDTSFQKKESRRPSASENSDPSTKSKIERSENVGAATFAEDSISIEKYLQSLRLDPHLDIRGLNPALNSGERGPVGSSSTNGAAQPSGKPSQTNALPIEKGTVPENGIMGHFSGSLVNENAHLSLGKVFTSADFASQSKPQIHLDAPSPVRSGFNTAESLLNSSSVKESTGSLTRSASGISHPDSDIRPAVRTSLDTRRSSGAGEVTPSSKPLIIPYPQGQVSTNCFDGQVSGGSSIEKAEEWLGDPSASAISVQPRSRSPSVHGSSGHTLRGNSILPLQLPSSHEPISRPQSTDTGGFQIAQQTPRVLPEVIAPPNPRIASKQPNDAASHVPLLDVGRASQSVTNTPSNDKPSTQRPNQEPQLRGSEKPTTNPQRSPSQSDRQYPLSTPASHHPAQGIPPPSGNPITAPEVQTSTYPPLQKHPDPVQPLPPHPPTRYTNPPHPIPSSQPSAPTPLQTNLHPTQLLPLHPPIT